jgi:hypothetical protein
MKRHNRRSKSEGGNIAKAMGGGVSGKQISKGIPAEVRKGPSPARLLSTGHAEEKRSGINAKSIGKGKPAGLRRFAEGGHATDDGREILARSRKMNNELDAHYAVGGPVHQGMRAVYEALHSHFENEPQMKKLGATKENVYEGEPHRARRASGGRLWMQNAVHKKGALHKALGVPMGEKIPMAKIEKAEHSKSPLMRKRARLAETFKKYRP